MLNLYAHRDRHPQGLAAIRDPVGPENDCTIASASRRSGASPKVVGGSDLVICAWGHWAGPFAEERVPAVLDLIGAPHCLGLTKHGAPRHPLYVKATQRPEPFGDLPPAAIWKAA